LKPFIMNAFRPCKFRKSKLGIFQCEKHFFEHGHPDIYKKFINSVPVLYLNTSVLMLISGLIWTGQPTVFINCTHPFIFTSYEKF
jgi:hypothetical protein